MAMDGRSRPRQKRYCAVDNCGKPFHGVNLCKSHHGYLNRHGISYIMNLGYDLNNCIKEEEILVVEVKKVIPEEVQIELLNIFSQACDLLYNFNNVSRET
jgi:hypothetical protein